MEDNPPVVVASPWLNVEQAAAYIQQHPRSIYRAAGSGQLRSVRINGKRELRFRREWIDRWMEHHAHGGCEDESFAASDVMVRAVGRR